MPNWWSSLLFDAKLVVKSPYFSFEETEGGLPRPPQTPARPVGDIRAEVGAAAPGRGRVVLASPCSGHGFKLAPTTGSAAVALAVEGESAAAAALGLDSTAQLESLFGLGRLGVSAKASL